MSSLIYYQKFNKYQLKYINLIRQIGGNKYKIKFISDDAKVTTTKKINEVSTWDDIKREHNFINNYTFFEIYNYTDKIFINFDNSDDFMEYAFSVDGDYFIDNTIIIKLRGRKVDESEQKKLLELEKQKKFDEQKKLFELEKQNDFENFFKEVKTITSIDTDINEYGEEVYIFDELPEYKKFQYEKSRHAEQHFSTERGYLNVSELINYDKYPKLILESKHKKEDGSKDNTLLIFTLTSDSNKNKIIYKMAFGWPTGIDDDQKTIKNINFSENIFKLITAPMIVKKFDSKWVKIHLPRS